MSAESRSGERFEFPVMKELFGRPGVPMSGEDIDALESVDHKADAEGLLGVQWRDDFALAQLAEAQVHATLYLAEQQRIANLIAYAAHRGEHTDATGGPHIAPALRDMLGNLDFEIREALGVNP